MKFRPAMRQRSFRQGRLLVGVLAALALSACSTDDAAGSDPKGAKGPEAGMTQRDGGTPGSVGPSSAGNSGQRDAGPPECLELDAGDAPASLGELACESDFLALAAEPMDFSLPGARSVKTVIDRDYGDQLYFQDTRSYAIHWDFASAWLSAEQGLSLVPSLAEFNQSEYYVPSRRFVLGAVTHYASSDAWVYELAPYDTADAATIAFAFETIRGHFFAPEALKFHPTSEAIAKRVQETDLPLVESQALLDGSDYVPFTLGETYGLLTLPSSGEGEVSPRIVVSNLGTLEQGSFAGFIGTVPLAPLATASLAAFEQRVPSVFLKDAVTRLAEYDGQWVHLTATASDLDVEVVSEGDVLQWWQERQSEGAAPPATEDAEVADPSELVASDEPVSKEVMAGLAAQYGETSAHLAVLAHAVQLTEPGAIALPKAVAIPNRYYAQFIEANGLQDSFEAWQDDPNFETDWLTRADALAEFRSLLQNGNFDAALEAELMSSLGDWDADEVWLVPSPNALVRAGGDPADQVVSYAPGADVTLPEAIKSLWAQQWTLAAFDARAELGIEPTEFSVGVLLEAGQGLGDASTSGFALSNNPFDPSGLEPCYYANVQSGAGPGLAAKGEQVDQWLLYFGNPNQPVTHLRLTGEQPLLTRASVLDIGEALSLAETAFAPAYRPDLGLDPWWAMQLWFGVVPASDPDTEAALVLRGAWPVLRR